MASGAERAEPGDSEQDEEEDVYEVEKIIDMRVEDGEVLYRVRWKNYTSDDDTWEPKAHLEDCSEVLLAYERALAERKPKKDSSMKLPMKSDLFDANSESESDKDGSKESPSKKKKKKRRHAEESEDEKSVKEKKKKKKDKKWKEDKPLPAPESEEEEDVSTPPPPSKKEKTPDAKKRAIESDDDDDDDDDDDGDGPALVKKHKKDGRAKDGTKQKKESVEERKKKKAKSKKEIESSEDETDKSDVPSESHTDDTTATDNLNSTAAKLITPKSTEKSSGGDNSKAKQKNKKSELKLQGFKDLIQDKKPKKTDSPAPSLKESGLNKLKSLTSSKSSSKSSRSEDDPDSGDTGASAKPKTKGKGQESNCPPQKDSVSSSSSSSALAPSNKSREEEPKEEGGEKGGNPNNLFEKFLLTCEAKDRVPRKQAVHTTPKNSGKTDKKMKLTKESPVQKPELDKSEKAKEGPRPGQSPVSFEAEEKQEKTTPESERSDRSDEPPTKTKEEIQREQKEEEQRRRKERIEEEERKRKERIEEAQRERKARMEEAQRERQRLAEEAQRERQRLAEEARLDRLDRRSMVDAMVSPESTEDSRWKERRRRRREDSESRLLIACDDNQDSQDPLERSDKTPDRGPPSLNLGVELKLDWMTLEDFQKHLNGEDENLSPLALTPGELREAVKNGNYMAVKRALSSKEDYNLDQEDSSGMSLSMLAAASGQDDILRLLIKKGVKVNGRQKNGTTALMHAAEKNFLTTVAILLEAGSCLNAQTLGGETALMKACKRGNADVVRLLLEYGADCNILSKHKNTALHFAKLSNNLMVYDLIKDHIQTLSTVAEETIRAYFESRLALLEPVFPLACHRLCEGPDFSLEFNYKPPQPTPGEGSGILLFIFHANFMSEITARLCGPCSVHAVILNDKFQLPIFLDSHFIYSFSPVPGVNKLFIRLAESPTAKVKLLICAYRVQQQ
ncbi:M-phase phosphoprotein 8 isoform X3 [Pygocentrus nattereri]|uniref:M-phase phosphoprotein 8 isoform X3 n=1 Tax=Pygocentrus nattereri TaxID=42514 RepID=UPI001891BD3B|nr:M-phase phosphoprotein 8 isoform X3 [Pygocentrus nattereri]